MHACGVCVPSRLGDCQSMFCSHGCLHLSCDTMRHMVPIPAYAASTRRGCTAWCYPSTCLLLQSMEEKEAWVEDLCEHRLKVSPAQFEEEVAASNDKATTVRMGCQFNPPINQMS